MTARTKATSTVDEAEVARFATLAAEWWDASGPMAPLHRLNPVRLGWTKTQVCAHFKRRGGPHGPAGTQAEARDPKDAEALKGLRILDVGCGGGLLSEPLTRMGAEVVGIDPAAENIEVARLHASEAGLAIDYRATTAEALAAEGEVFDVVTALEVVEHVTDVALFVAACGAMVKPGGLMIAATINRTMKAYALAIVGAEYILRWLPRGTHAYDKLVKPSELAAAFRGAGLSLTAETGIMYVPHRRPLAPDQRHGRQLHDGRGKPR